MKSVPLHFKRSCLILDTPLEDLFTIRETTMKLPGKANVEPSITCMECGEPVMQTKMEKVGERLLCRGCIRQIER